MDEQLNMVIQATAQALGAELTPEQLAELTTAVSQMIQNRTGEPMKAVSLKAAFNDAAFRGDVMNKIKAYQGTGNVDTQDIVALMQGDINAQAGAGGVSKVKAYQGSADSPQISVKTTWERYGLDYRDMAYYYSLKQAQTGGTWHPDKPFLQELADGAMKASGESDVVFQPTTIKSLAAIKANELVHTQNTGFGEEAIPDLWMNEVWRRERMENVVAQLFGTIEMTSNPFNVPLEGVDPEMYAVPETTDIAQLTLTGDNPTPVTKAGTDKLQLVAAKLALRIAISDEEEEDALYSVLAEQRQKALQVVDRTIDSVMLNADDSTSGNVNLDGGTPSAFDNYMFGGGTGLVYQAISRGLLVQAASVPTLALFRELRFTLDPSVSIYPSDLAFIVDPYVYAKLLDIPEFLTVDKMGPNATVVTGVVGSIDGVPVRVTNELKQAAANGKVSSTAGNNTKGRAICVYTPAHKFGYRRRIRMKQFSLPGTDAEHLSASVRVGMAHMKNFASLAMMHDITV